MSETQKQGRYLQLDGHRVIERRYACSMTQQQLAEAAGLDRKTIGKVEASGCVTPRTLEKLANALSLKPSQLIATTGKQVIQLHLDGVGIEAQSRLIQWLDENIPGQYRIIDIAEGSLRVRLETRGGAARFLVEQIEAGALSSFGTVSWELISSEPEQEFHARDDPTRFLQTFCSALSNCAFLRMIMSAADTERTVAFGAHIEMSAEAICPWYLPEDISEMLSEDISVVPREVVLRSDLLTDRMLHGYIAASELIDQHLPPELQPVNRSLQEIAKRYLASSENFEKHAPQSRPVLEDDLKGIVEECRRLADTLKDADRE